MRSSLAIFDVYCAFPEHIGYTNSLATAAQLYKNAWHRVYALNPGHVKTFLTSIEINVGTYKIYFADIWCCAY
jgi:hypothetical protein